MTRSQARSFRMVIGQRLRERRLSLGMTQEEVAWEAGIAQGSISHYEQGKNEVPLAVLISLCRALQVSPIQIVPGLAPSESSNGTLAHDPLGDDSQHDDLLGHPQVNDRRIDERPLKAS